MSLRKQLTAGLIRLGPRNQMVWGLIESRCRPYGVSLVRTDTDIDVCRDTRTIRISLEMFPLASDVARDFERMWSEVEADEVDGRSIIDCSRAKIQRYKPDGLEFYTPSFPEERQSLDDYTRYFAPAAGDLVFDIGAYCGVSTYMFSKLVGNTGRVIAFEPDPRAFDCLVKNLELHACHNVVPLQIAMSDTIGTAKFHSEGYLGSTMADLTPRSSINPLIDVPTTTLETVVGEYGHPDYLKMDIEGAELQVLESSLSYLTEHPVPMVIDTGHTVAGALTTERVEHMLSGAGYSVRSSASGQLVNTWASPAGASALA